MNCRGSFIFWILHLCQICVLEIFFPNLWLDYSFSFFLLFIYLFIYFWLRCVFVAAHGLSLVAVDGGFSSLWCAGCSLRWLLLLWNMGSRHMGFSSCGTWVQQLWRAGLVALRHVGSSWTRARTHVPWIGRQILNHCATREVLFIFLTASF